MEFEIVQVNKINLGDLARLYTAVYGIDIAVDFFIRKYDTAFTGVENVGFIAYDSHGKPVAYYGVIPCFIRHGEEIILSAQSGDTMTHPKHRYKGLFVKLSNMTFDLCRQIGIRLVFGFPNQNSYPAMIKTLGWIETEKMSRFSIPVNVSHKLDFFRNRKQHRVKVLNELLSSQSNLRNSVIEDGYSGVYRDDAYFNYKNYTKTCVVKIGSGDVWIKIGRELIIGDISLNGTDSNEFFSKIISLADQLHLNKISFQVSKGCRLHDLFASRYNAFPSFPVLFKDFESGLPLDKIKFTFADIDIF